MGKFSALDFAYYGPAPCNPDRNQTAVSNQMNKDQSPYSKAGVGVRVEDSCAGLELARCLLGDKWGIFMKEGLRKVKVPDRM